MATSPRTVRRSSYSRRCTNRTSVANLTRCSSATSRSRIACPGRSSQRWMAVLIPSRTSSAPLGPSRSWIPRMRAEPIAPFWVIRYPSPSPCPGRRPPATLIEFTGHLPEARRCQRIRLVLGLHGSFFTGHHTYRWLRVSARTVGSTVSDRLVSGVLDVANDRYHMTSDRPPHRPDSAASARRRTPTFRYSRRTTEVPSRDLRNDTAGVLQRVQDGQHLVITVKGRSVTSLVPLPRSQRRWLGRDELVRRLRVAQADPDCVSTWPALPATPPMTSDPSCDRHPRRTRHQCVHRHRERTDAR
ncbi:type II toxin-antitoxin system Phd/YefM family antitoxin [Pseudonocardia spinosispora]|uniref:type II toxin-antitoxin system Phd/YefM family antitoxin n=1 Tax=Pseudonocardia spinosispora TaxID=103441 RepID=UPI003CCBB83C